MNRDFIVPIIFGNEDVLIELLAEVPQIPAIIDCLLEFTNEARGKGIDFNASVTQGNDEEEMILWSRGKGGLIDRDFKIYDMPISESRKHELVGFPRKI